MIDNILPNSPQPQATDNLPRTQLAARRHTLIFLAICLAITVLGAANANRGAAPGASTDSSQMLQLYLLLIGMEWLWVRFVHKGMQAYGHSVSEFIGHGWFPRQLAGDLTYAAVALGFSYLLFSGLDQLLQSGGEGTNPLLPALPRGPGGISVWVGLSLSAGICEEIVFRGYLQRQLAALSGSTRLAILGQAVAFGIAHGYEGAGAVLRIIVFALAMGLLAQWRGNIRAGILAHATWDILAGLGWI